MTPAEIQRRSAPPSKLMPEQQTFVVVVGGIVGAMIMLAMVVGGLYAGIKLGLI